MMSSNRARRPRRFGHVYPRRLDSGRRIWSAQWRDPARAGRRTTRSFATRREAVALLARVERRLAAREEDALPADEPVPPPEEHEVRRPVPSFVEYATHVLETRLAATVARGTLGAYRAALRALGDFLGQDVRLDQITVSHVLDYRGWRAGRRYALHGKQRTVGPRTINADQQFLSRILNEAVLDGHLPRSPIAGLKKLREARAPRRYLTKDEALRLVAASPAHLRPLVVTALYTGARKGELLALTWGDVDLERGKLHLVRTKVGSCDVLDLHPHVRTELVRQRRERKSVQPTDPVFLSTRGTRYTNPKKAWDAALAGAGLSGRQGLTFHSLRHTFATHFLEGGGATTDLQQQLGHAALATTQIYAAALNERRRAAVLALDFLGGGKASADVPNDTSPRGGCRPVQRPYNGSALSCGISPAADSTRLP